MTATTASVRFGADGTATVQSYVRLTASTHIQCCTYADAAPILTIQDWAADITITNPGHGEVTGEDVRFGREAGRGRHPVRGRAGEARRREPQLRRQALTILLGRRRDTAQTKAGGQSWYPPAALGSLPVCTKEVTRLCARS